MKRLHDKNLEKQSRTRHMAAHAATFMLATLSLALTAIGQEIPTAPDHYAALDPFLEGEIVAIREGGGVIKIVPAEMDSDIEEPLSGDGARDGTWIELRHAKGWVFFDDPEGREEQRRYNLREGRQRFAVGQIVAIGREPSQGGGWESTSIRSVSGGRALSSGSQVRLLGWVLVRVTPFREDPMQRL